MGTVNLTYREKMPEVVLPPYIPPQTPDIMLGAYCYLQVFSSKIDHVIHEQIDGRLVHMGKSLYGSPK